MKPQILYRSAEVIRVSPKAERTVELSFASESPIERLFGYETLSMKPDAVRLDRLRTSGPVLVNHNPNDLVGKVERVWIDGAKARARVRFGRSERAAEIWQDVQDGIRDSVSVGYISHHMTPQGEHAGQPAFLVDDWEPLELSFAVPAADVSVGVGRTLETEETNGAIDMEQTKNPCSPSRAAEVLTFARMYPEIKEIERFLDPDRPLSELHAEAKKAMQSRNEPHFSPAATDAAIGLTGKETRQFSLCRALHALANPNDRKAQEAAAFEFDASRMTADQLGKAVSNKSVLIPGEVQGNWMQRDLLKGTDTAGGFMIGTDHLGDSFIELLRARTIALQLGTTMSGLQGDVQIPKQSAGATVSWVGEDTAVSEQTQTIAQVTLRPRTLGAYTNIGRKLLLQANPDAEQFVRNDLTDAVQIGIDAAAINGDGVLEPLGILNTSGVGSVVCSDPDGGAIAYGDLVDLVREVAIDNADVGRLAMLTNPEVRCELSQILKHASDTASGYVWEDGAAANEGKLLGTPAYISTQVPNDLTKGSGTALSALLYGNWSDLVIGLWGGLEVIVDPYTMATKGTVRVTVLQDADIVIRHAESFAVISDISTA